MRKCKARVLRRASGLCALVLLLTAPVLRAEIVIEGQVRGPAGPLNQARIELIPFEDPYQSGRLALLAEPRPAKAGALSDSQGWFRLVAPESGLWRLVAAAPGFVPMEYPLVPLTDETDVPVVELHPDAGLEIRVSSEKGQPLAGARVLATPFRSRDAYEAWKPEWMPAPQIRLADEKGVVRLAATREVPLRIEAGTTGYPGVAVSGVRQSRLEIRLTPGSEQRFQVRAPGHRAAAEVLAWAEGMELPAAASDADGWMTLSLPKGRRTAVRFLAAGGEHGAADLLASSAKPVKIDLEPAEILGGRVLDLHDRTPVAGALVWLGERFDSFVRTDRGGGYRLPVAAASRGVVHAAAPGYFEEKMSHPLRPPGPAIALRPRSFLSGLVVDGKGRPLGGVEVRARFRQETGRRSPAILWESGGLYRSGRDGRFRVDRLVPGVGYSLRFATPGFAPRLVQAVAPSPESPTTPLRVVLDSGATAIGLVRDKRDHPVAGAVVELQPSATGDMAARIRAIRDPDPNLSARSTTDSAGRFEVRDLLPGRFDLAVRAPAFAAARIPGVAVPAGQGSVDLGTVILEDQAEVLGRVQDAQGKPLEGAAIRVAPSDPVQDAMGDSVGSEPDAVSDGAGRFQIPGQRPGDRLRLAVERSGYAPASAYVAAPTEKPAVITLTPASRVTGRVADAEGEPVAGIPLGGVAERMYLVGAMATERGHAYQTLSRDDGSFTFDGVEPGPFRITAYGRDWQESGLEVQVPEGANLDGIELILHKAAVVAGQVTGPEGDPAAGAEIRQDEPLLPGQVMKITPPLAVADGEGRYQIGGLSPGPVALVASHGVFGRAVQTLEILAGENHLDFQLRGGQRLSGRVVDTSSGTSVPGAQVWIRPAAGEVAPAQTVSEADGSFVFDGLAAGDYRIEARKEGLGKTRELIPVQVGEGGPEDIVVVELARTGRIRGRILGLNVDELAQVRVSAGWGAGTGDVSYDGSYDIPDLAPGAWHVLAELPRTGRRAEGDVTLDAEAGEADLDLDFSEGLVLSGAVARNGHPFSGASIRLQGSSSPPAWSETDLEGRFRLEGLMPGQYRLEISDFRTGLVHARQIDLEKDEEILLDLRTQSVAGRTVDSQTGQPLPQVEVMLTSADIEGETPVSRRTVSAQDGSFFFPDVGEGSWRLLTRKSGYDSKDQIVVLDAHSIRPVEITLAPIPRQTSDMKAGGLSISSAKEGS